MTTTIASSIVTDSVVETKVMKAPLIEKAPKTLITGGLHYSLLSRVKNALTSEQQLKFEAGSKMLSLTDGRGQVQQISEKYLKLANDVGGAKYLSQVRSSHVRKLIADKNLLA